MLPLLRCAAWCVVATGFALIARIGLSAEPAAPIQFEEQLVADGYGYAYGVAAGDLAGDGDRRPDIAACAERGSNEVRW